MHHAILAALLALAAGLAAAQTYPARPIRMLTPYPPGGGVDIAARVVAQKLAEAWGQQVIVDPRPGAGGNIAMELAARAPGDGYTLIMTAAGPTAINPRLYRKIGFDPLKDFAPVALVAQTIYAAVIHPSIPARNIRELIGVAKSGRGAITFGSTGIGGPPHLAGELFKSMTGIDMVHVPYKGAGPALQDLMGGQLSMMFADVIAVEPHMKSGRLRGLAVSTPKRFFKVPELPTVAESGVTGYEAIGWTGLLAPASTPAEILGRLNAEIVRMHKLADVRERLAFEGSEFGANSREGFADYIRSELAKWGKVIQTSGATAD